MLKKLVYDDKVDVSYGMWVCPECGSEFYGGGRATHYDGCPLSLNTMDYSGLEFHFGPAQVRRVIEMAGLYSEDFKWYGISLVILKEQFPELLGG